MSILSCWTCREHVCPYTMHNTLNERKLLSNFKSDSARTTNEKKLILFEDE